MLNFARKICKNKTLILIIAILLLIPSFFGMKATRVNYDILVYLPENIETMQGQNILQNDFNMGSYSIVLLDNMKTKDIKKLEEKFRNTDNVEKVVGVSDILGTLLLKNIVHSISPLDTFSPTVFSSFIPTA